MTEELKNDLKGIKTFFKGMENMLDKIVLDPKIDNELKERLDRLDRKEFAENVLEKTIKEAYEDEEELPTYKSMYSTLWYLMTSEETFDEYVKLVKEQPLVLKFMRVMFSQEIEMQVSMQEVIEKVLEQADKKANTLEE